MPHRPNENNTGNISHQMLNFPNELYGREGEIQEIQNFLKESGEKQQKKILFISGPSGIGKSALCKEITRIRSNWNHHIAEGSCDFSAISHPYYGINMALGLYFQKLISNPESQPEIFFSDMKNILGKNASIIVDQLPVLDTFIGPLSPLPPLPPQESRNRFNLTFQNLFKFLANERTAFTLILDDLQWADKGSLDLIYEILSDQEITNFTFIGTYRSDDLSIQNISMILTRLNDISVNLKEIRLQPLSKITIEEFIKTTLNNYKFESEIDTETFLEHLHKKTMGNPFYLKEYLKTLHRTNLISSMGDKQNKHHLWNFSLNQTEEGEISNSVKLLLVNSIKSFSPETINGLKVCFCLGSTFHIDLLSEVLQLTGPETLFLLKDPLKQDILKLDKQQLSFSHNKIMEAIASILPTDEKKIFHYRLGNELINKYKDDSPDETVYQIARQWNQALDILTAHEKQKLAKINLTAGILAKKCAAYESSSEFLRNGSILIPSEQWKTNYKYILQYYKEWSEAEYLARNFTEAERLFDIILNHTYDVLDKEIIYSIIMRHYITQMKFTDALNLGLKVLKELKVSIPAKPTAVSLIWELLKTKLLLRKKKAQNFFDHPRMENSEINAVIEIMSLCFSPALISNVALIPLLSLKMFNLSIQHGFAPMSAFAITVYANLLAGPLGNIKEGIEYGRLAKEVMTKYNFIISRPSVLFSTTSGLSFFQMPFNERQAHLLNALQQCLEDGNFEYYGYMVVDYCWGFFFSGNSLPYIAKVTNEFIPKISKLKQPQTNNYFYMYLQAITNMSQENEDPLNLSGPFFKEMEILPILIKTNDNAGETWFRLIKVIFNFILGENNVSLAEAKTCEKKIDTFFGLPAIQVFLFYYSLILASINPKKNLSKINKINKKFLVWSFTAPFNFKNKQLLIQAEIYKINNKKPEEILLQYDLAIKASIEYGFNHEEAIANELAAKYCQSMNLESKAKDYMQKAFKCYEIWSCKPKLIQMKAEHASLLE
jgi:predicted ATPase